jgi:hypothetical protein
VLNGAIRELSMLGNLRGWIISAVIAAFFGVIIYTQGRPGTISKSTGQLVTMTAATKLPADPTPLVADGTEDCNAGDLYRQAMDDYKANAPEYERVLRIQGPPFRPAAQELKGVQLVLDAAKCSKFDLYAGKPREVANYERSRPGLEALQTIGQIVNRLAASMAKEDPKRANQYAEALFLLGRRLYEERVVFQEYSVGVDLMANAANTMARQTLADDPPRAEQMGEFVENARKHVGSNFTELWTAISGIEEKEKMLLWAGDVFDVATNPNVEPMWRTEAALKLGRMRWMGSVKAADQKGANRTLKQLADDPSVPLSVRTAAAAGRDLTVEKFRVY